MTDQLPPCPRCGMQSASTTIFCPNCGLQLAQAPPAGPTQPSYAPPAITPPVTLSSPRVLLTILLGVVLAIFIVPFAGPWRLPALLIVIGLVVFDIWRQMTAHQRGDSMQDRLRRQPLWIRLIAIVGMLAIGVAIIYIVQGPAR